MVASRRVASTDGQPVPAYAAVAREARPRRAAHAMIRSARVDVHRPAAGGARRPAGNRDAGAPARVAGDAAPVEQAGEQENSNVGQRSNFESNYPDGVLPGSGVPTAGEGMPPGGGQTLAREDTYGPAPARTEIVSQDADPTARDHPADQAEVPDSVATGADNQDYLRYYSSPAAYEKWRRRAQRSVKR